MTAPTTAEMLRLMLDDPDAPPRLKTFSDDQITALLTQYGSDLNLAASAGWMIRASIYAKMLDHDEPEARKYTDLYKNARQQAKDFLNIAAVSPPAPGLAIGKRGFVGRSICLREPPHDTECG